jgi:hypothetical protein
MTQVFFLGMRMMSLVLCVALPVEASVNFLLLAARLDLLSHPAKIGPREVEVIIDITPSSEGYKCLPFSGSRGGAFQAGEIFAISLVSLFTSRLSLDVNIAWDCRERLGTVCYKQHT